MTFTLTKQNAISAAVMDVVTSAIPTLNLLGITHLGSDATNALVLLIGHIVLLAGLLFSGTQASSVVPAPVAK